MSYIVDKIILTVHDNGVAYTQEVNKEDNEPYGPIDLDDLPIYAREWIRIHHIMTKDRERLSKKTSEDEAIVLSD